MPIVIMSRKSLALIDQGSRSLPTSKEKAQIHLFVLFPSMSLEHLMPQEDHETLLPIIPYGIVAYGFVGQPFSKQQYMYMLSHGSTPRTFQLFLSYRAVLQLSILVDASAMLSNKCPIIDE